LSIPMMGQWIDSQQDYDVLCRRARMEAQDIEGILESHRRSQESLMELQRLIEEQHGNG